MPAILRMRVYNHRLVGLGQVSEVLLKGVFKFHLIVGITVCTLVDIPSV